MIKLEKCPICKAEDFQSLDYLRDQGYWYDKDMRLESEPVGFKICTECGFVTYDYLKNDRLQEIYDRQRPIMNPGNIITCNRKNEYHKKFLEDIDFDSKTVLDVGCAQGSFLDSIKSAVNLYGTEWSAGFRAYAKNEYELNVATEIDTSLKYDLISYYHVLEHCQDPDKELMKIRDLLTDDGYLYISVPIWFDKCDEPGGSITNDFENYYHLNHVNVFSYTSIKNLLKKCGFGIFKANYKMYGYTILCKKIDLATEIDKEDYKEIVSQLELQKEAIRLIEDNQPDKAIEIFPKFPDAYVLTALNRYNMKEFDKQREVLEQGLKACPGDNKLLTQLAKMYFQWDESKKDEIYYSNNVRKAEELFLQLAEEKPGNEEYYYFLGMIEGKYKKNYDKAVEYMNEMKRINPMKFQEAESMKAWFWREKELEAK